LRSAGHQHDPIPLECLAYLQDSKKVAHPPDVLAINKYLHGYSMVQGSGFKINRRNGDWVKSNIFPPEETLSSSEK
jgi:hypothetical protein